MWRPILARAHGVMPRVTPWHRRVQEQRNALRLASRMPPHLQPSHGLAEIAATGTDVVHPANRGPIHCTVVNQYFGGIGGATNGLSGVGCDFSDGGGGGGSGNGTFGDGGCDPACPPRTADSRFAVIVCCGVGVVEVEDAKLRRTMPDAIEARVSFSGGKLLYGWYLDEPTAVAAAAQLRREGLSTVLRPAPGPELAIWSDRVAPTVIEQNERCVVAVGLPWALDGGGLPEHIAPERVLELTPGASFGTGAHPTTRSLLDLLARHVRGGERVLDFGCGSGVLGLVALHLGAACVVAVDVEEASRAATTRNAALQGHIGGRVRIHCGLGDEGVTEAGPYDIVLANVPAQTLKENASKIAALVAEGGCIGISGISRAQVSTVVAAFWPTLEAVTLVDLDVDWSMAMLVKACHVGEAGAEAGVKPNTAGVEDEPFVSGNVPTDGAQSPRDEDSGTVYCCYLLAAGNPTKRTYVGITTDLPRRLRQHNGEIKGGAKATRAHRGEWAIAGFVAGLPNRSVAQSFEWHVKHNRPKYLRLDRRAHRMAELARDHELPLVYTCLCVEDKDA